MTFIPFLLGSLLFVSQALAFTFPKQSTKAYDCDLCSSLSHVPLQTSWDLSGEPLLDNASNQRDSYGYRQRVTSKQLKEGVVFITTAPGAIIRITPVENKPLPVIKITPPHLEEMSLQDASSLFDSNNRLGNSLLNTPHQVMLQIKKELGFGKFTIQSEAYDHRDDDIYVLSVYDKYSLVYLELKTDALHYQFGDEVIAQITMHPEASRLALNDLKLRLTGPNDQYIPMKVSQTAPNQFAAKALITSDINDHGENWTIEATSLSRLKKQSIKRTVQTAFSYSIPSAKLIKAKLTRAKTPSFLVTIEVATASRYAIQSVLFDQDSNGKLKPTSTLQKAQWFEPGIHELELTFDNTNKLGKDNRYIGYWRLLDYGQLKTIDRYDPPIKLTQLVD